MSQFILQAAEGFQAQAEGQSLDGQGVVGEGGGGEHAEPQVAAPDFNFLQGEFARMKEAADMLHEQAAATKAEMRKGKIATSTASIKTAAGKRTVKKLSEASHMLVDVDDLWVKLGREAIEAGSRVATHDNLDRINTAIDAQAVILFKLKQHIQTELTMHAAAAKSNLGWKLVGFMEQDPDLDKIEHGMDINELRAKEKALMQHDRDMLAACRIGSVGQGSGRGVRGSRGGQVKLEDSAGDSNPKKAKKQRPNMANQTCYNCNGLGHMSYNCSKPKKKRN